MIAMIRIAVIQSHPERVYPADVEKLKPIASASDQMSQRVEDLLLLDGLAWIRKPPIALGGGILL